MSDMEAPDRRVLRRFGLTMAGAVVLIFGLLPAVFSPGMSAWPWLTGVVLIIWALSAPSSLRPLYLRWMWLAVRLGWFGNTVVLSLVYFLMFLPLGLLMRAFGRDSMRRNWDPSAESYRVPSANAVQRMERPF